MTPQLPSSRAGAGESHELELLKLAAARHDVHVISSGLPSGATSDELSSLPITYEGVDWIPTPQVTNRAHLLAHLLLRDSGDTFWQQGNRVEALSTALQRSLAERRADLVHVMMGEVAPVLAASPRPRTLLLFDAYTRQMTRELHLAKRSRDRLNFGANLWKVRRWEAYWYRLANAVACVSQPDGDHVSALLGRPVSVIHSPVPERFFDAPSVPRSRGTVAFVASLSYRPNVDAVEWFAREIWPVVRARAPKAKVKLVGRDPVPAVLEMAQLMDATVHANVEDVRPHYWDATVTVAPIRLGSGARQKILHAMSCGAPVVATPTGVEGLDARGGEHLLIADDATEFADAVLDVLTNPETALARAKAARSFVERFRPEAVGASLEEWWRRAVPRTSDA